MRHNKKWIFIPFAVVAFAALAGGVVMLLWNSILPDLLGLKKILFWQALGLFALCRILFGGWGGKRGKEGWRGRKPPSPEERERLKELWRARCKTWKNKNGQD